MVRTGRSVLIAAALLTGTWTGVATGQDPPPPPSPAVEIVTTLPYPDLPPEPVPFSGTFAPPAGAPFEDYNDKLLVGDPLLDPPCYPGPGLFFAVDVGFLVPHVKNRLTAEVNVADVLPQTVHLPSAELDGAVSPRFELGYRFGQGGGEVLLTYRFLTSEGRETATGLDPLTDSDLVSRLCLNRADLDYASREFSLGPRWDMRWQAGVSVGDVFFDSRARGQLVAQRVNNHFIGGGPHAGLGLGRSLCLPGLALFARVEGALLVGRISQNFEETVGLGPVLFGGASRMRGSQAIPVGHVQAGLSWAPPGPNPRFRLAGGYEIENWWFVGKVGDNSAEVMAQGGFFRFEWRY